MGNHDLLLFEGDRRDESSLAMVTGSKVQKSERRHVITVESGRHQVCSVASIGKDV